MELKRTGLAKNRVLSVCAGMLAMLAIPAANATLMQFTQTGVMDNATQDVVTLTAWFHSDDVLASNFEEYSSGPFPGYMDPSFSLRVTNVTLNIGGSVMASANLGTFDLGGDLNVPSNYDAFWWFAFDGWTWSVIDALAGPGVTAGEFAQWTQPEADFLSSRDYQVKEHSLRAPDGTRTRLLRQSGDLQITVVPEPSTLGLLALGLGGVLLARRRSVRLLKR